MKEFLKKIGITTGLFTLGLIVFVITVHLLVKYNSDFKLSNNTKFLIVGHSHPATAFDDSIIDQTQNISRSGESYFYNYQKIKEVIKANKVEAVFIEYSNNQISANKDDWIWGYEKMNSNLPRYAPFMTEENISFLYHKNSQGFVKVISTSTLMNFIRILSFDYSLSARYGGYEKLNQIYVEKEDNQMKPSDKSLEISDSHIEYLENMVTYCQNNNVKVNFFRSPQHKNYPRFNENVLLKIKEEKFKGIEFLDFDHFPLKDSQFADIGHLNYDGASKLSIWFNSLLKKGLMNAENKELFIKKEMIKIQHTATAK